MKNFKNMIKQILSIGLFLSVICINSAGQTETKADSSETVEKASYPKELLTDYISKNLNYPSKALENNIQGDVILSVIITSAGKMQNLVKVNSPDMSLLSNAIVFLSPLDKGWSPAKVNGLPVDRSYQVVIRYRMYLNSTPVDYNRQINDYIKKQKYEKALKACNNAIEDNKYEHTYYKLRSGAKEFLGDTKGAKSDLLTANDLNNKILLTLNVTAMGIVRKTMVVGTSIEKR